MRARQQLLAPLADAGGSDGSGPLCNEQRQELRAVIGAEAEALVDAFARAAAVRRADGVPLDSLERDSSLVPHLPLEAHLGLRDLDGSVFTHRYFRLHRPFARTYERAGGEVRLVSDATA